MPFIGEIREPGQVRQPNVNTQIIINISVQKTLTRYLYHIKPEEQYKTIESCMRS